MTAKMIIVSVRPMPSSRAMSLPSNRILVVPKGTANVGTGGGAPGLMMKRVPVIVASLGTSCGRLVGDGVGEAVAVAVGSGRSVARASTVLSGVSACCAVSSGVVTRGVLVGGKLVDVAVGDEVAVASSVTCTATAVGASVGMGSLLA